MIIGLIIYLLGVLAVAIVIGHRLYSDYKKDKSLQLTASECVFGFFFLIFSWVTILSFGAMWLQNHEDDVIISIGKEEEDGNNN